MRECKTCGIIIDPLGRPRGSMLHEDRCSRSTPEERAHYKRIGHWPKVGQRLRPLPPELPEPPPTGGADGR